MPLKIYTFILLAFSLFLSGCGEVNLYSNLTEREANEMMNLLHQGRIEVFKEPQPDGMFLLKVAKEDMDTATAVLQNHGLPRESRKNCEQMFEKSSGLIRSPTEERGRIECHKRMSLEDTLSTIEGVITAKVELTLPPKDPLNDIRAKSSAGVILKTRYDVEIFDRMQIKKLVTDAIPGLNYKDVTLIIDKSPSMLEQASDLQAINNRRNQDKEPLQAGAGNRMFLIGGAILLFFTTLIAMLYQRGRREQQAEDMNLVAYEEDAAGRQANSVEDYSSGTQSLGLNRPDTTS